MAFYKEAHYQDDSTVVDVFAGTANGSVVHLFPNLGEAYFALAWHNGPTDMIGEAFAWAGDHYGSDSLYRPSIFSRRTLNPDDTGGITFDSYGYEGPPEPQVFSIELRGVHGRAYPYRIEILVPRYMDPGTPPLPEEPCPPDPLYPYRATQLTSVRQAGIVPHGRRNVGAQRIRNTPGV